MINPAKPFSSRSDTRSPAAAARADLSGLLDRARDERFRLLKMLKDARAEVAMTVEQTATAPGSSTPKPRAAEPPKGVDKAPDTPAALPTPSHLQHLVDKLTALDARLDAKLHRVTQLTDDKLARMEQLDARLTAFAKQLGHAAADAKALQRDLDQTVARAERLPAVVTGQLERFDEHVVSVTEDATQAVVTDLDAKLAESRDAAEHELAARFNALAQSLQQRAQRLLEQTDAAATSALDTAAARVRKHTVESMAQAHDRSDAFRAKLAEHHAKHRDHLADLTDAADAELQVHAQRLDQTMTGLTELFDSQADAILNDLRDRATALLDRLAEHVAADDEPPRDEGERHAA